MSMISSVLTGMGIQQGANQLFGDAKGKNKNHTVITELMYNTLEIDEAQTITVTNMLMNNKQHSMFAHQKEHGRLNSSGIVEPAPGYNHYVYENLDICNDYTSYIPSAHIHFCCKMKEEERKEDISQKWTIYYLNNSKKFVERFVEKLRSDTKGIISVTKVTTKYGIPTLIKTNQILKKPHMFQKFICKELCKHFFNNNNTCTALTTGQRGCGKTYLGYCLKYYIEKTYSNKFKTVNLIMDCDITQAGLDFNNLIFCKNQKDVCNILVLNEFNRIINSIESDKNKFKSSNAYTDTFGRFLDMMDMFEHQMNLFVLLSAEKPQEYYAYKMLNGKLFNYHSVFRDGRIHKVFRIKKNITQNKNTVIVENPDDWIDRHWYMMWRNFWIKHRMKKFRIKYNGYTITGQPLIKYDPSLLKNNSNKKTVDNNLYFKNKKILYILNIFYNFNHFSFLLLSCIFMQILKTSFLLLRDFLWIFIGRKCIFIKKDLNYELEDINNDNMYVNFYNNTYDNGYENIISLHKEHLTINKFKIIIWCYYLSILSNYYKDTIKKYFNKTIVLDNYKIKYENNNNNDIEQK